MKKWDKMSFLLFVLNVLLAINDLIHIIGHGKIWWAYIPLLPLNIYAALLNLPRKECRTRKELDHECNEQSRFNG